MNILNVFKSKSKIEGIKKSKRVEDLVKALSSSYDDTERIQATLALGEIGDPKTIEPLILALKDYNSDVREYAAIALEKIGTPAVEPLIKALFDKNSNIRYKAAEALGEIKDNRARGPLTRALMDEDLHVQLKAKEALERLGL